MDKNNSNKNKTPNISLKMRIKAGVLVIISQLKFVNHTKEKIIYIFSSQEYKIFQI